MCVDGLADRRGLGGGGFDGFERVEPDDVGHGVLGGDGDGFVDSVEPEEAEDAVAAHRFGEDIGRNGRNGRQDGLGLLEFDLCADESKREFGAFGSGVFGLEERGHDARAKESGDKGRVFLGVDDAEEFGGREGAGEVDEHGFAIDSLWRRKFLAELVALGVRLEAAERLACGGVEARVVAARVDDGARGGFVIPQDITGGDSEVGVFVAEEWQDGVDESEASEQAERGGRWAEFESTEERVADDRAIGFLGEHVIAIEGEHGFDGGVVEFTVGANPSHDGGDRDGVGLAGEESHHRRGDVGLAFAHEQCGDPVIDAFDLAGAEEACGFGADGGDVVVEAVLGGFEDLGLEWLGVEEGSERELEAEGVGPGEVIAEEFDDECGPLVLVESSVETAVEDLDAVGEECRVIADGAAVGGVSLGEIDVPGGFREPLGLFPPCFPCPDVAAEVESAGLFHERFKGEGSRVDLGAGAGIGADELEDGSDDGPGAGGAGGASDGSERVVDGRAVGLGEDGDERLDEGGVGEALCAAKFGDRPANSGRLIGTGGVDQRGLVLRIGVGARQLTDEFVHGVRPGGDGVVEPVGEGWRGGLGVGDGLCGGLAVDILCITCAQEGRCERGDACELPKRSALERRWTRHRDGGHVGHRIGRWIDRTTVVALRLILTKDLVERLR